MITPVFVLLVCFLRLFVESADVICIPNYFRYLRDEPDKYMGRVEISFPPKGVPLQLSVTLSIAAVLPTAYVGRLELAQSREESVKSIQQGRPLRYTIHFPLRQPVPNVNEIWFNDERICTDRPASGQMVTSIVLNHTLYPPGVSLLNVNDRNMIPNLQSIEDVPSQTSPPSFDDHVFTLTQPSTVTVQPIPSIPPKSSPRPPTPTVQLPPGQCEPETNLNGIDFSTQLVCGRKNRSINLLIAGGTKTDRGQWPWLAAIFVATVPEYDFQCAGSLITNTHVITAAHCMWYEGEKLPINAMVVSLGRYELRNFREDGSVNMQVSSYRIHPDYKRQNTKADADLAILILREKVEYSYLITPVCLWMSCTEVDKIVGKEGTVVGWGRDEHGNQYTLEPRTVNVPVVSQEDCLRSRIEFVSITSYRTFCAGSRNKTGPCNGDSGSGFVMHNDKDDRYYLRGVVSSSLLDKSNMSCDLENFVVYVDVAKHINWIHQQLATSL